jgi:spore germination cell wall hydrolase CwlJ-like protein
MISSQDIRSGIFWLILTVFLEARDQKPVGQKAVTKVILNRCNNKEMPVHEIVLAPRQFSCFNEGWTKSLIIAAKEAKEIGKVTLNVLDAIAEWEDGANLSGATHYFNPRLVPGRWPKSWDRKKMVEVGEIDYHSFYREV